MTGGDPIMGYTTRLIVDSEQNSYHSERRVLPRSRPSRMMSTNSWVEMSALMDETSNGDDIIFYGTSE